MGIRVGDTGAWGLFQNQRVQLLGQCTDLNAISWLMATIQAHLVPTDTNTPDVIVSTHLKRTTIPLNLYLL